MEEFILPILDTLSILSYVGVVLGAFAVLYFFVLSVWRYVKKVPLGRTRFAILLSGIVMVISMVVLFFSSYSTSMPLPEYHYCAINDDCITVIQDNGFINGMTCINGKYLPDLSPLKWSPPMDSYTATSSPFAYCTCDLSPDDEHRRVCHVRTTPLGASVE